MIVHKKKSKVTSSAVRARSESLVKSRPTIILERLTSRAAVVETSNKHLTVDPRVQRVDVVTPLVQELSSVLLAGGSVPDPVKIAERPDGTLSIVDGQQRYWAYVNCKIEKFPAIIYKTDGDIDTERKMFTIFNRHVLVNANTTIKSWPGPIGAAIRDLEAKADSPLYGMIGLGNPGRRPLEASILVSGLLSAVTGVQHLGGSLPRCLTRLDTELAQSSTAKERLSAFARLIAAVFIQVKGPRMRVRRLMAQALGVVAHKHWKSGSIALPSASAIHHLRQVKWEKIAPSWASRYLVNYVQRVERLWPVD